MKDKIHPPYKEITVTCGCGNSFKTGSTRERIAVEVCSSCHPFYTGKEKLLDAAGRVERFQKKYAWSEEERNKMAAKKPPKPPKPVAPPPPAPKPPKVKKEKPAGEAGAPPAPGSAAPTAPAAAAAPPPQAAAAPAPPVPPPVISEPPQV